MAISDAAKAAAVMHYVCEDGDTGLTPERAAELFNELGSTHGPIDEILERYEVGFAGPVAGLGDADWWESLELMALTIDAMFDYFEFRSKELLNERIFTLKMFEKGWGFKMYNSVRGSWNTYWSLRTRKLLAPGKTVRRSDGNLIAVDRLTEAGRQALRKHEEKSK